jgi:histone-arginine methyltransferase CARM1
MLNDLVRTSKYKDGILNNAIDFKGKIVMDVGCGSGILSIFAAQAGAKKVYAIEASNMAKSARLLVAHNKLSEIIEVIQMKIEEIAEDLIPASSIDIIVSEPLGTYLFNERMLETYVIARDRFLKPEGLMFPTESNFFIIPFEDMDIYYEQMQKVEFWSSQTNFYGLDLTCLGEDAIDEKFAQPILDTYDPKKK